MRVSLIDDLDGSEAEATVQFGLDVASYEIDLNTVNGAALRNAFAKYVEHARKADGAAGRPGHNRRRAPGDDIRAWARAEGFDIKDRGRMPADVVAKYRQMTGT